MAVNFYLEKRTDKAGDAPIRVSVIVCGVRLVTSTGYSINPAKWGHKHRVKQGCSNAKGITYTVINSHLNKIEQDTISFENRCLTEKLTVTADLIKQNIDTKVAKSASNYAKETDADKAKSLFYIFDEFVRENGKTNDWTLATYEKFAAVRNHLKEYRHSLSFDLLDEKGLQGYVSYLRDKKAMRNTTIGKQMGFLKWFLRWATSKGYNSQLAFQSFKPKLKGSASDKKVIFLTWDELMTVYDFPIPESKQYLARVRDVFCFCCFTSLRYSDVYNLKKADMQGNAIHITTVKTDDSLVIQLNDYSREILSKYKDIHFEGGKALPVISNQKMNDYIKELGQMCGIDEQIRVTYYKGNERIDEYFPKYELLGTHCGRRTFICNALSMGVAPQIVMKWTGHSDYSAMKPYIDITDKAKEDAMEVFNRK